MQARYRVACAALILLLAGCSSTPPFTESDIDQAAGSGQLEALYRQIHAAKQAARSGSGQAEALAKLEQEVAARIAAPTAASVRQSLDTADRLGRLLSLEELAQLHAKVATIRKWQPATADQLDKRVNAAHAKTSAEIDRLSARLDQLSASKVAERYATLHELATLNGGDAADTLRKQADQELQRDYEAGKAAVQSKELDRARALFAGIAAVDPGYKDIKYQQQLVTTGMFEQRFWQALVDGRPGDAYQLFHDFAETPAFVLHRDKVGKDAADLADYFDALGDKRRRQGDWSQAFAAFKRAEYIRGKLGISDSHSSALARFLSDVEGRFKRADAAGQPSLAYAWLTVIQALQPQHPLVLQQLQPLHDKVLDRAEVKLSVEPFEAVGDLAGYGAMVATDLTRYLLSAMPNHVRVIERDELRALSLSDRTSSTANSQSYYLIDGDMLKADVTTSSKPRTDQRRVQTGTRPADNPDHDKWSDLPRSQRKQTPEPPKTIDAPVYSEVTMHFTDVTKAGSMTASYRVIDPATAKVLHVDTVGDKATYSGSANAALTQGSFHMDAAPADVPADADILETLANSLAKKIGKHLTDRVNAIEQHYEVAAKRYLQDGEPLLALRQLTYAVVVNDDAPEHQAELIKQVRETALNLPRK